MDVKDIWYESVDWINVAQDRFHYRAVVCPVMKVSGCHKMKGN